MREGTIDEMFKVKAEADFWWSLIAPGRCPCGSDFERPHTRFFTADLGGRMRLAVRCSRCDAVRGFGLQSF